MAIKYLFYTALLAIGIAIGSPHQQTFQPNMATTEEQPPVQSIPKYQAGKDSSLAISMPGGTCSASLYGKSHHVILTAYHCWDEGGGAIQTVNGMPVTTRILSNDGHDHIFVHVDQFVPGRPTHLAPLPAAGTEVYLWGNPLDFRSLLRIGYVSGRYRLEGVEYNVFQLNSWHGDSGGGVFDAQGDVVAVIYGMRYETGQGGWDVAICQPMAFTAEQVKAAELG